MKILINNLIRGGASTSFALELVKGFISNGYDTYLITPYDTDILDSFNEILPKNHIAVFKNHTSKKDYLKKYREFKKNKEILKILENEYFISLTVMLHTWNKFISKKVNAKHVMGIIHDPIAHSGTSLLKRIKYDLCYKTFKEPIVLSEKFIPYVEKKFSCKCRYFPHGLFTNYKYDEKYKINFDENKVNFIFFGNFLPYKGLDVLGKAYESLKQDNSNCSLTIAGSGDFASYKEIYDNLKDVKVDNYFIPNEQVASYFNGPNIVLVLPYKDATQSGPVNIARFFEVPIIATKTGGLIEELDNGNTGIFAEPNDVLSLKEAMLKIMNINEYNKQKKLIKESNFKYEWKNIVHSFIKQLEIDDSSQKK